MLGRKGVGPQSWSCWNSPTGALLPKRQEGQGSSSRVETEGTVSTRATIGGDSLQPSPSSLQLASKVLCSYHQGLAPQ